MNCSSLFDVFLLQFIVSIEKIKQEIIFIYMVCSLDASVIFFHTPYKNYKKHRVKFCYYISLFVT